MRVGVPVAVTIPGLLLVFPLQGNSANADSVVIRDFERRISEYLQVRRTVEANLPRLRTSGSPEKIADAQSRLADAIIRVRRSARRGDIFTPAIEKEFRRLIRAAVQPDDATHIRKSLRNAEPVAVQLQINHPYPGGTPLQSMPPSILLNLPHLPADIEYRFVSRALTLLDTKANLIIDFMTDVSP